MMNIRKKMLLYFSVITIVLLAMTLSIIYFLFSAYREEDFQQRQKEKVYITLQFLSEFQGIDQRILEQMDQISIDDLFNEKLLIFDQNKKLIYTSIDDTPILYSKNILSKLNNTTTWYEAKDGLYDVIGVYLETNNQIYYGISKAYDTYGYTKLDFLRNVLLLTFFFISFMIVLVVFYVSKKISKPITDITNAIANYDIDAEFSPLKHHSNIVEMKILLDKFNGLMNALNLSFAYQKNAIQHISHELQTPISILVSNFDRIQASSDPILIKSLIQDQQENTKNLSDIISLLLEITKVKTSKNLNHTTFRIDDLIFDKIESLERLHPNFHFSITFGEITDESELILHANIKLIELMLTNILLNAIHYSDNQMADIHISTSNDQLQLEFSNFGQVVEQKERQFLFQHFFRGSNAQNKKGFGLGLVFIHKIVLLHNGTISYQVSPTQKNIFTILLPLKK